MAVYGEAVKDISMILLIIAGSGIFKQIMEDSGVSNEAGDKPRAIARSSVDLGLVDLCRDPFVRGIGYGGGVDGGGVVMPLVTQTGANPNLMVLSLGAGSLMFSHVNDSGFWMFKEYFNLSIKDTICSWSIMETIVSVVGLIGVMILNMIV